ncbi:MAG: hypothetical protein IPL29_07490 [Propionivibrio sp.]|nr:hypothetical protein [Propionivibrio sp.]
MDSMICILLELYRGARELTVPEFQELALALIKPVLRFDSGIWGAGEVSADAGLIVPPCTFTSSRKSGLPHTTSSRIVTALHSR